MRTRLGVLFLIAMFLAPACGKPADPAKDKKEDPGAPPPPPQATVDAAAQVPDPPKERKPSMVVAKDLKERLNAFALTPIDYDDQLVTDELKPVLRKIIEAAKIMDEIFLVQVDPGNPELRKQIAADPLLADALAYFDVMFGPWDRKKDHEPFVGERKKPKGAGFYPEDMTKEELEAHLKKHPKDRDAFTGYFTVIRRRADRTLEAVPYGEYYQEPLGRAAKLLREAADLSKDARLQRYLRLRAEAFEKNDYRPSDKAWMELGDGAIEVVIGPYEVYEDGILGAKAAFEAFVTLRDPVFSDRLQKIEPHIPGLQEALPLPPADKAGGRGKKVPISVVVQLYTAGDTKSGVQTLAFNLPNDEVVRQEKGFKLVLLKNVGEAKFQKILLPIAKTLMDETQLADVTFEAFFTHTLMHETAHGLGPGMIKVQQDGKVVETDVNKALKDLYSTIEEAKADILGLWASARMIDKGVLPKTLEKTIYTSFVASIFRSIRFGVSEAHGRANLVSFNYLLAKGGIALDAATSRYRVDHAKIRQAVTDLATELLTLEARGDYAGAKAFIEKHGTIEAGLKAALEKLGDVPVDIRPDYRVLTKMAAW
jgi:hypothetical protein